MKATSLLVASAALALSAAGVVPSPVFVSEASAQIRGTPNKGSPSKGKSKRGTRNKSKSKASAKVSSSKKAANSGKTSSRKRSGKSSKSAVPSTAPKVSSSKRKRSKSKAGTRKRASMTAVANVPLRGNAASTPNATPSQRTSLDVSTSARSPRSRRVTKRSNGRRAANNRRKQGRTTRGQRSTTAVQTAPQQTGRKVTFNLTPQVVKFDTTQPANAIRGGSDNRSTVSSVLSRRPMALRQQGALSRLAGTVKRALTWGGNRPAPR